MASRLGNRGFATLAGAMVVAGPVAAACTSGPTYDEWASTDGAAGRINLEAVQEAFQKSKSATAFEDSVNRIYEGDGLILIRSRQNGDALTVEGFEDLDRNGVIDETADDLLFSIRKDADNKHQMRGHGANGYYNRGFGAGDFLFTYMLISALSPRGYYYQTPRSRSVSMNRTRSTWRNSSSYRSQVSRNTAFGKKNFTGSRYDSASRNLSQGRAGYQASQKRTGTFKSSGTGVRSKWGTQSSRSRFGGGARGGGGAQVVIGFERGRPTSSR